MVNHIGPVKETELPFIKKKFPYEVDYSYGSVHMAHHFALKHEAEAWRSWADKLIRMILPIGVSLDLRSKEKPFVWRSGSGKTRRRRQFHSLEELENWVNSFSTS